MFRIILLPWLLLLASLIAPLAIGSLIGGAEAVLLSSPSAPADDAGR